MNKSILSKAKILFFDIETSPNYALIWRPGYNINVSHDSIVKERQIICVSYSWLHSSKVTTLDWGKTKQDDTKLLHKFSKVLQAADLVVTQNGDKFDIKWIQGRLMERGLPPCSMLNSIDTLKLTRGAVNLNSYKLDYLGSYLGVGKKSPMVFQDWKDILLKCCPKALLKMIKYCEQDVKLLKKVFKRILPYVKLPVHMGAVNGQDRVLSCPNCGSLKRQSRGTRHMASGLQYRRYQCTNCHVSYKGERIQ